METAMDLISTKALWLEVLSLAVFFLMTVIYLFSSARPLVRIIRVVCPINEDEPRVRLKINIFKDPRKAEKGLDVVGCPHFSGEQIRCSKGCVHSARAQRIHQIETKQHVEKTRILAIQ